MIHKTVNMLPARQAVRKALIEKYNEANDEILRLGGLHKSLRAGGSRKPTPKRVVTRISRLFEARKIAWTLQQVVTVVDEEGNWILPEVPRVELWDLMKGQDRATLAKMGTFHKKHKGRIGALHSPKKGGARQ